MKGYLKTAQLAEIYQVSKETIRRWIRTGKIKGTRIGKFWYVPKGSIRN